MYTLNKLLFVSFSLMLSFTINHALLADGHENCKPSKWGAEDELGAAIYINEKRTKLAANLISSAGATRIMTIDLHADQIQGFFEVPVDHLFGSTVFMKYIESLNLQNLTIASPDVGGSKRANAYAKYLKAEMVICYKKRLIANQIEEMRIIGSVEGRDIILVDDMIDTGGPLVKAAKIMKDSGAKSVRAICTHPVLSGEAHNNIEQSLLEELIVSDTLPIKNVSSKIKVLTISNLFADVINSIDNNQSISSQFLI